MKPCPVCKKRIQDAVSKCHHCGAVVRPPRDPHANTGGTPARAHSPAKSRADRLPLPFRIAIAILVFGAAMAWLVW